MLGFDYFALLDHLTIARSRRHIEKYYGTAETGTLPRPPAADQHQGRRRPGRRIPLDPRHQPGDPPPQPRRLCPLRYVLPHKQEAYDAKYSTQIRGGESFFRQVDREESLIHLLRVNVLKRMESAVSSFALTVHRQLQGRGSHTGAHRGAQRGIEELDIADVDIDDPAFEPCWSAARSRCCSATSICCAGSKT
jgi:hypothetical protein